MERTKQNILVERKRSKLKRKSIETPKYEGEFLTYITRTPPNINDINILNSLIILPIAGAQNRRWEIGKSKVRLIKETRQKSKIEESLRKDRKKYEKKYSTDFRKKHIITKEKINN